MERERRKNLIKFASSSFSAQHNWVPRFEYGSSSRSQIPAAVQAKVYNQQWARSSQTFARTAVDLASQQTVVGTNFSTNRNHLLCN